MHCRHVTKQKSKRITVDEGISGDPMSYTALVHKVMISCPSDAYEERDSARDVIHKWNSAHAEAEKKIMLPVDWLHDAVPDAANSPQMSINNQITDKSDMLIAIFRHKIGTPTDSFLSGTVEEIEHFIKSGKPVLLYFSSANVPPDLIEQYNKLSILKDKYKSSAFYSEFLSPDDFKQKLSQHIQQKAHDFDCYDDEYSIYHGDYIVSKQPTNLSDFAIEILKSASATGRIIYSQHIGGFTFQAGHSQFGAGGDDMRKKAELEHVIEELVREGYIKDDGYKREIFSVTKAGYDFVESMQVST